MELEVSRLRVCVAITVAFGSIAISSAQVSQPKAGTAAAKQSTAPATTSQAEVKTKLLASPEWKQINAEFQKWLAAQPIYTPADVERINRNLAAQIQTLPASELQGFLDDWQARLKVLKGENFQEAQEWLGQYLSVLNSGVRRQALANLGLTDVANMSAAQLENVVIRVHADRLARQQRQAAFDQTRQQRVQMVQQSNAATRQARQPTGRGAAQFGTNQSPYRPPKFNPPPLPRQQFIVDGDGRIGFILPY